jgi:L-threonylcarbamoyladenylate synthase
MSNSPFLSNCTADTIRDAAAALKAGHLVAFPTETVYGLGADARNPIAVKRIYEVKGRPSDHPLIVHVSSINQLKKWASEIPDYAITLARNFWPGPMTLILKRTDLAGDFITGGQDTVGLRVPSDPIALALIQEFEKISNSAIAAPSANRFGQVSPTSSSDVYEELGEFLSNSDILLNGGNSSIGIESTIIDCTGDVPRILRSGYVTYEDLEKILEIPIKAGITLSDVKFSGSFEKHYAPKCKVLLGIDHPMRDYSSQRFGFLAMSNVVTPNEMDRLGSPESLERFAQILYSTFREADRQLYDVLFVTPPIEKGLGNAICERLRKASQGR